eukprot:TRINITY_DN32347_c0_g1_i1.p2 TRINITY_DN32347_c0_g1~~TRINITY_DN32347_c0_g1_i1.p2  ORF type:complete len:155 (-),score=41.75 TRINITY_DN32347_c0_g1_i1:224-688(-)
MAKPGGFDISNLPVEALNQLKQNTEQEIEVISSSITQLRMAVAKFQDSKRTIASIGPETNGQKVLVPLTSSMYIPGTLAEPDHVLIDIGTGYFVKKSIADAQAYTDRRSKTIAEQAAQLSQALAVKKKNLDSVLQVMQYKLELMQEAQDKKATK